MRIALVDTAHSNIRSVERALSAAADRIGGASIAITRTHDPDVVRQADKIVVPGQGGFGDCVQSLRETNVDEVLIERVRGGTPYLGICLGLQALFESSPEAPGVRGLGLIAGTCQRLVPEAGIKIPHMGWNSLELQNEGHRALRAAGGEGAWVYFVHSFHAVPRDKAVIKAVVSHGSQRVTAAVAQDNILATQFHPEKSQEAGLRLLRDFLQS